MLETATKPSTSGQNQIDVRERRRPGRIESASPELIALMRKPTPQAIHQVALYDAPHFVLPRAGSDSGSIDIYQMLRFATAFGICATVWLVALKLMMVMWG